MGGAKRAMEEREEEVNGVLERLIDAGAVERCEFHEYPVDQGDSGAEEEVRSALANEIGQEKADELVDEALTMAYPDCPGCESNRED